MRNSTPGLDQLAARGCDLLGQLRNWRSALAFGVAGGGAIGPANIFRADLGVNTDSAADGPQKPSTVIGRDQYAAPCIAAQEHLP
jgi:hypothetical protein